MTFFMILIYDKPQPFSVLFEEAFAGPKSPQYGFNVRRMTAAAFCNLWAKHTLSVLLPSSFRITDILGQCLITLQKFSYTLKP